MCSSLTVSNFNSTMTYGSDKGVGLDMRWLISLSWSVAPPDTGCDWNWVEVGLEAKTEICVPYGTKAQVHGSHVESIRLMVRSFLIRTKNKEQRTKGAQRREY